MENKNKISPSARISDKAKIGRNVEIGDYVIIGDNVVIGDNTRLLHHAVIYKNTEIGEDCKIFPFASIGTEPQDITYKGEDTKIIIGNGNVIREFTTINLGTVKGGGLTSIGNNNYFMAYTHIAHDCNIGNNTIFINGATLAGHVEVEDFAVIGANSSVHQFVRIGRNSYVGGYTVVLQDVLPFAKIAQARKQGYNFYGPNSIGMMRNGFSRPFINNVKSIFELVFKSDLNTTQAVDQIKKDKEIKEESEIITEFISKTRRGIIKNFDFNS